MSNLKEILTTIQPEYEHNFRIGSLLRNEEQLAELDKFLDESGFKKLSFLAAGSGAIVLCDDDNPDIVIRIATDSRHIAKRIINPHVLQALFVKNDFIELYETKVEILPKLKGCEILSDKDFTNLRDELATSTHASNTGGMGDFLTGDYGIFEYSDPNNRGTIKQALMAADDSALFETDSTHIACISSYPSLQVQQAKQQTLWENDPRLQRLLPNGPATLPDTRIIPNIQRQDFGR